MIAIALLAYVAKVSFGEAIREVVHGKLDTPQVTNTLLDEPQEDANQPPKWLIYIRTYLVSNPALLEFEAVKSA